MMVSAPTNRLAELVRLGIRHEEIMMDTENHSKKLEKTANLGMIHHFTSFYIILHNFT